MYALNERVGLVTGGGAGIGREIARRFVREGMAVAVLDRDGAEGIAAEIRGVAVTADVTSEEEVSRAVETVLARFSRIDVLVNNAGIAWMGPALEMPVEALQSMLRVNVEGVFIVSRAVLPHMIARRSGSIVNLASWAGKTGNAFFAGYLADEIESLGKSDRRQLRSQIRRILRQLLKLEVSPALDPRVEWCSTIRDSRSEIEDVLHDSPSL